MRYAAALGCSRERPALTRPALAATTEEGMDGQPTVGGGISAEGKGCTQACSPEVRS